MTACRRTPPPDPELVACVLSHLLRPGEEEALAWPVELAAECPFAARSWWEFIEGRWQVWADLGADYEHVPVGWTRAAVRLFGGDAWVALRDLDLPEWPGAEAAEAYLRDKNTDVVRVRRPWERT